VLPGFCTASSKYAVPGMPGMQGGWLGGGGEHNCIIFYPIRGGGKGGGCSYKIFNPLPGRHITQCQYSQLSLHHHSDGCIIRTSI
jgi:hypothetical protein